MFSDADFLVFYNLFSLATQILLGIILVIDKGTMRIGKKYSKYHH
jgi:hypothetical protein